ncbi:hypothetical protein COB21_01965 [Candidatus Aerophobetes bacterium]|uniref:Uncharacterized protein n=1 Tax=Aerophobetes bacterium TaxID=2030807 RepID=A0A2A4X5P5_UNCAE|nr:MAG: hypothetical protein COB21_01965 [Candidatus Aerophobetes bacterium]
MGLRAITNQVVQSATYTFNKVCQVTLVGAAALALYKNREAISSAIQAVVQAYNAEPVVEVMREGSTNETAVPKATPRDVVTEQKQKSAQVKADLLLRRKRRNAAVLMQGVVRGRSVRQNTKREGEAATVLQKNVRRVLAKSRVSSITHSAANEVQKFAQSVNSYSQAKHAAYAETRYRAREDATSEAHSVVRNNKVTINGGEIDEETRAAHNKLERFLRLNSPESDGVATKGKFVELMPAVLKMEQDLKTAKSNLMIWGSRGTMLKFGKKEEFKQLEIKSSEITCLKDRIVAYSTGTFPIKRDSYKQSVEEITVQESAVGQISAIEKSETREKSALEECALLHMSILERAEVCTNAPWQSYHQERLNEVTERLDPEVAQTLQSEHREDKRSLRELYNACHDKYLESAVVFSKQQKELRKSLPGSDEGTPEQQEWREERLNYYAQMYAHCNETADAMRKCAFAF